MESQRDDEAVIEPYVWLRITAITCRKWWWEREMSGEYRQLRVLLYYAHSMKPEMTEAVNVILNVEWPGIMTWRKEAMSCQEGIVSMYLIMSVIVYPSKEIYQMKYLLWNRGNESIREAQMCNVMKKGEAVYRLTQTRQIEREWLCRL